MRSHAFPDGVIINGDGTCHELMYDIVSWVGRVPLIIADPPYGNVLDVKWDRVEEAATEFAAWMYRWTRNWEIMALQDGGAFYVWGGIGIPGFRPFFHYVPMVEGRSGLTLSNLITWSKRRAYGVQHNYLFTREECAFFIKGDPKKPRTFNVPYTDELRGYEGYNKKYPARSPYKRRTNVWTDITEVMRGKVHPAQKPKGVIKVPILTHTKMGEWVIDPFAGSGTTGLAARDAGRNFILIEKDEAEYEKAIRRLEG